MASFSFGAGNAGKLLRIPLYVAGRLATLVIPRTHDLWVFGCAVGVTDGAWALWRRAAAEGERAVWLTGSAREDAQARAAGIPFARKGSLRGFWLTARAAVTVVTHGFGDVNRYAATGGVIVQLWHGIPLKRIGLDADVTTQSPVPVAGRAVSWLLAAAYRRTQSRITILPAASELVRGRLESAFGLPTARVPVTGDPRDDVLSAGPATELRATARARLDELAGPISPGTSAVLFAPTWRDGAADPTVPTAAELDALQRMLTEQDAVLLVRAHHLVQAGAAPVGDRVRPLGGDLVPDATGLLTGVDVLVTDYSSMLYDAALAGVPTVFFAPDLAAYADSRGFYGTYRDVAGDDVAHDWTAVIAQVRAVIGDAAERERRTERARSLSGRVHAFSDGLNTDRVYRAVRRQLATGERIR